MHNAIDKAFTMTGGRLLTASLYDLALTNIDLPDKTANFLKQSAKKNQDNHTPGIVIL